MKKIILISGKAEHGKDLFASILKEKLEFQNNKIIIDRFAKYIKMYLKDFYNWDGITKDEFYRHKLQWLGTERIKQKLNYKAFHAKRIAEDIQIVQDDFDYFILSDCRFPDEIYTLKAMFNNVITVRVNRSGYKSRLTKEQLLHASETALDEFQFDCYINNNGTIEDLRVAADKFIEDFLNDKDIKQEKKFTVGDKVKIVKVNKDIEHLNKFVDLEGYIISWYPDIDKRIKYHVDFNRKDIQERCSFYEDEMELV